MTRTRRQFLRNTAVAAAALLVAPIRGVNASQTRTVQTYEVNYDTFAPLVTRTFQLSRDGVPVTSLQLVKVEQPASLKGYRDPVRAARNSFILIFRSEQDDALKEGIYTFSRPELVPFSAFISPINNKRTYQIVYNRNTG